jgi:two-component system response regulator ChvI
MCKWKNKTVNLTVTEFLLIKSLVKNTGVVKSRDQLILSAFGEDKENIDDRAIDHHFKRIRKKFKNADNNFNSIVTIYGGGYKFSE